MKRTALYPFTAACILALSACGATKTETDDANAASTPSQGTDSADNLHTPSASSSARSSAHKPSLVFTPAVDAQQETIPATKVSESLQSSAGGTATCKGDLSSSSEDSITCQVKGAQGAPEEWHARSISTTNPEGMNQPSKRGILYTTSPELSGEALKVLANGNNNLTGMSLGANYGESPISKEQLSKDTLKVLTSKNAKGPAADAFKNDPLTNGQLIWEHVECDSDLDFKKFTPVNCTATISDGDKWNIHVLPGNFYKEEPGLLMVVGSPRDV